LKIKEEIVFKLKISDHFLAVADEPTEKKDGFRIFTKQLIHLGAS